MSKSRAEAYALLTEYTKSESLIKHALAVESAMAWYARNAALPVEQVNEWKICGLLHDFDYELHPDPTPPDGHPYFGNRLLEQLGYSEEIRQAIMGHALYTNTPRATAMARTLFAVDELCGLVTASVYVRPDRSIHNLEAKSVQKKMKDKAFARGCNREDIRLGSEELGIPLDQHITNVIAAMREEAAALGLAGAAAA